MNLYFLDADLLEYAVVDVFKSLIWTKRYYTYGDFELYLPASEDVTDILRTCPYVSRDDDETVMVVENIEITTDAENGDYYIITGHSLESILTRRIVWEQTNLSTNDPAQAIYQLIDENAVNPDIAERQIVELFIDDTFEGTGEVKMQLTGTQLDKAITSICRTFGYGWKITRGDSGEMIFALYQRGAVPVTFSREFDNLISSDYYQNSENYKNVALVAGEGEGTERRRNTVSADPAAAGLTRYELYVDARDISSNNGEISDADYMAALAARGMNKMLENHTEKYGFAGEVSPDTTYKYKTDYDIGNIVTVSNGYGVTATPRIVEIIECWDDTGYNVCPTFETWEV